MHINYSNVFKNSHILFYRLMNEHLFNHLDDELQDMIAEVLFHRNYSYVCDPKLIRSDPELFKYEQLGGNIKLNIDSLIFFYTFIKNLNLNPIEIPDALKFFNINLHNCAMKIRQKNLKL